MPTAKLGLEAMGESDFRSQVQSYLEGIGTIAGGKSVNKYIDLFVVRQTVDKQTQRKALVMSVSGNQKSISETHLQKLREYQSKIGADSVAIVIQGQYTSGAQQYAANNDIDIIDTDDVITDSGFITSAKNIPVSRRGVIVGIGGLTAGTGYLNRHRIRPFVPPFLFATEAEAAFADNPEVTVPEFTISDDSPPRLLLLTGRIIESGVTTGDSVTAEIAVANAGGNGTDSEYEMEFSLNQPNRTISNAQEEAVIVEPLKPRETSVVTVGPFEIEGAGEWTIRPRWENAVESGESLIQSNGVSLDTHSEYNLSTIVQPTRVNQGEWLELKNGLRISAEIVEFTNAIFYDTTEIWELNSQDVTAVRSSPPDEVFAHIGMEIENQTQKELKMRDGEVDGLGGVSDFSVYQFAVNQTTGSVTSQDVIEGAQLSGEPIHDISLPPGSNKRAWALTSVPINAESKIQFGISVTANKKPEYAIDMNSDPSVAKFELIELDAPDDWVEGRQEIGVIVENTGKDTGTFRGTIQRLIDDTWVTLSPPLEAEIQPGKQTRTQVSVTGKTDDVIQFRALPFNKEFEI